MASYYQERMLSEDLGRCMAFRDMREGKQRKEGFGFADHEAGVRAYNLTYSLAGSNFPLPTKDYLKLDSKDTLYKK